MPPYIFSVELFNSVTLVVGVQDSVIKYTCRSYLLSSVLWDNKSRMKTRAVISSVTPLPYYVAYHNFTVQCT